MTPLESAAVAYVVARRASLDAKAARNGKQCPNVPSREDMDIGVKGIACWVPHIDNCRGDGEPIRREFWCHDCQERQRIHDTLPKLRAVASGALRRLTRIATAADAASRARLPTANDITNGCDCEAPYGDTAASSGPP